ncbi:plasmid pRiA4b ORF-3 family protein [Desulfofundulus sp. TPOSR]|nr:plasmid pRiA4b ORF-3 family protein [Desulfofundulus sp. TPOSR]
MGSNVVYQLKITLQEIEPPIWRRVLVPAGITFYKLHKIIQAAFGWQDYHLFDFDFGDVVVHIPDPDYAPGELYGGAKELNAKRTKIDALLSERKKCVYTYDFGDNWRHDVILETIMPVEEGRRYPVCVAGARHRPPEDVGGVSGYEEFLRIIRDPGHPEYNDYLVWAEKDTGGRKFDPEYFYINEVNRALAKIKSTTPH